MSLCASIFSWLLSVFSTVWEDVFYPLYSNIGALSFILFAFALNLLYFYFLGRFIQGDGQSDGARRRTQKKSGGGEE